MSTSDPGFGLAYLGWIIDMKWFIAHSVLYVNNVFINANDEQRKRLLPPMCTGEAIGGVCMTEPDCGTDILGMKTTATRKGDVYLINGRKMFITNGAINGELGDAFLVYAKVDGKLTSFVVEKGMPGFSLGQQLKNKLGMRASGTAELVFDNVPVPVANRIGEEGQATLCMVWFILIVYLIIDAKSWDWTSYFSCSICCMNYNWMNYFVGYCKALYSNHEWLCNWTKSFRTIN